MGKESTCDAGDTGVWSLGQKSPLEKEMASHSSVLAWEIPWTEEAGGLQSSVSWRVRQDWVTKHTQFNLKLALVNIKKCEGFFLKIIWGGEKSAANFVRYLSAWKITKKILVAFYFLLKYWWLTYYISFRCTTQWFNTSINYTLYTFVTVSLTVFPVLYLCTYLETSERCLWETKRHWNRGYVGFGW